MKKEKDLKSLFNVIKNMGEAEFDDLTEWVMARMASPLRNQKARKDLCKDLGIKESNEKPDCPHCAAKAGLGYIIKRGINKGSQRYYCKSCGKYFKSTTNTAFAYTRKDADTWRKFIKMTLSGESLKACEEKCDIAHLTAFTWRHKILNVFAVNQESTKMSGNVEADEMQIPISYKGNHIKGNFGRRTRTPGADNGLPRKSYQRGTDNKSKYPRDKACIFCMVQDGNKGFYAAVPGVGFMDEAMLNATVAKHVKKENAVMLVDDYNVTRKYLEKNGYAHMILKSNTSDNPRDHKVEVKDGLHIQHANNMHQQIRKFLRRYNGVSSKYLSNYISLYVWLKNVDVNKQKNHVDRISTVRAATPDCYITWEQLSMRPAVPQCA